MGKMYFVFKFKFGTPLFSFILYIMANKADFHKSIHNFFVVSVSSSTLANPGPDCMGLMEYLQQMNWLPFSNELVGLDVVFTCMYEKTKCVVDNRFLLPK